MKRRRLLNIIGDINDDYVAQAATDVQKKKKTVWIKWVAAAACFALVLVFAAGIPTTNNLVRDPDKDVVDTVLLVEYNKAYYEVVENNPQFLERRGIENEITEKAAGEHITYLKKENESERSNYIVSEEETDSELLEYAPAEQEAVMVLRDGENYFAVIFCNFLIPDTEGLPFDEIFKVYGVAKPEDIKSIASVKTDNEYKANGPFVTDRTLIASFYNEISALEKYSEYEFDKIQFTHEDESKAGEYHRQFADDRKDIMIETADGLKFIVSYYPTFDWISGSQAQTYYRLSPALEAWIETNLTR